MGGSDGAAWLDGDAAQAFACDASITLVVIGEVNYSVLDDLVRLCVELGRVTDQAAPQDETLAGPFGASGRGCSASPPKWSPIRSGH